MGDIVPQTIEELALKVKAVFGLDSVRLVRYDHDNPLVSRVAICGGSGQGFYKDALKKGAQVFITGDVYYHTGQEMITNGLLAIDPGHHVEALFGLTGWSFYLGLHHCRLSHCFLLQEY